MMMMMMMIMMMMMMIMMMMMMMMMMIIIIIITIIIDNSAIVDILWHRNLTIKVGNMVRFDSGSSGKYSLCTGTSLYLTDRG